jgi:hypothetical protein
MMSSIVRGLLWDEFEASQRTSLLLNVTLPPLGPAFIAKGKVGHHFKLISRNGLVILMSTVPPRDLPNSSAVRLRVAIWHRSHVQNEPAMPHGLLLHAKPLQIISTHDCLYRAEVTASHSYYAALSLELGGTRFLNFFAAVPH